MNKNYERNYFFEAHRNADQPALDVPFVDRDQLREVLFARPAPGGPELHEHDLALVGLNLAFEPVEIDGQYRDLSGVAGPRRLELGLRCLGHQIPDADRCPGQE